MLTQAVLSEYETVIDETNNYSLSSYELPLNGIKLKLSMDTLNETDNIPNSLDCAKPSHLKIERLSPKTNGLRSGNVTPSSSSPLQCNDMENRNFKNRILSSNNLENGSDFSTRNYSDFMRSLAAKYNNNTNDNNNNKEFNNEKRHLLLNNETNSSNIVAKNFTLVSDKNKTHNKSLVSNVSPLVTSLLSSLQFSSNAFPPIIDMSSTQALVTLARASKEVEIQNILRTGQKRRHDSSAIDNQSSQKLNSNSQDSNSLLSPFLLSSQNIHQQTLNAAFSKAVKLTSTDNNSNNTLITTPLDLSSAQIKRTSLDDKKNLSCTTKGCPSKINELKSQIKFQCQIEKTEVITWTVDDVCKFIGNINACAEYVEKFREQCIDGYGLPLLTENHLINVLGMKLGPALKLRTIIAKKLGGPCPCFSCTINHSLIVSKSTNNSIEKSNHHKGCTNNTDNGS